MAYQTIACLALVLGMAEPARAQLSQDARFAILGTLISAEAAARIGMPLGGAGIEMTDNGQVDVEKLQKELSNNGQYITAGKIVTITAIEFDDKSIEVELDNGGTKKKGFLSKIQLSVGGVSSDQGKQDEQPARGSKITLKFANKISPDMTPDQLKGLLNPLLDFTKQSVAGTGIEALPLDFQEAVKAKEARIGMDSSTVRLALGAPNRTIRDKSSEGVEQVEWIYELRGNRMTFVTFEEDLVVSIREY